MFGHGTLAAGAFARRCNVIEKERDEGDREQIEKLPPTDRKPPPEGIDKPQEKKPRSDQPPRI